jgi:CheY-like chemotaxis protein
VERDDYFSKPVNKSALQEALKNIAQKKYNLLHTDSLSPPNGRSRTSSSSDDFLAMSRVLLVEDNKVNARIASVILKKQQFSVDIGTQ